MILKNRKKTLQQPSHKKKEKIIETKENLDLMLKDYENKLQRYIHKVARLRELLSRRSTKKRPEHKLLKMNKQLVEAEEELSFSEIAIDQIKFRLSQIS